MWRLRSIVVALILVTLLTLLSSGVEAATGDITAVRIASAAAHNGWVAEIDIDSLSTGGTYAFGLGTNNDPSTAKAVFTVTSPGYDTSGNTTTISRTVYGTKWVRQAYPNQATADESTAGSTLTIRVSLSDFVYQADSSVSVAIASGLYTQGGTPTAAYSGAVTNNSTLTMASPVGRWAWVGYERVAADFVLEAVVFHRHSKNGQPLAMVRFTVTDGSHTETVDVTRMTVSTRSGAGSAAANKVLVYAATIPISGFTQGAVLTANFSAYPWVGQSGQILTSNSGISPPDERLAPLQLLCDKNSTYGAAYAVVDATNGHNSTASTWVTATQSAAESNYASSPANSYTTIGNAAQALKAYNNATYGRNEPGGGTILLTGNHSWPGTTPASTLGAQSTWMTITRLSSVSRGTANINAGTNAILNVQRVRVTDVTLSGSSTGQIKGNVSNDVLWVDDCNSSMTGTAPFYQWKLAYYTRNVFSAWSSSQKLGAYSTSKGPAGLIRGNAGPTAVNHLGVVGEIYAIIGNYNVVGVWVLPGNAASEQVSENSIYAFNAFYGMSDTAQFTGTITWNMSSGVAIVQNVLERSTGNSSPIVTLWADGAAAASSNVILWHNTLIGNRTNIAYNDTGSTAYLHSLYSVRNNLFNNVNNKDDTFTGTPNAGRTGSWPVGYWVGGRGNYAFASAGLEWFGEFPVGLNSVYNGGTPGFVDNNANNYDSIGGDGTGNGDYHLTASSSAFALVPSGGAVLPFDLEGTPRNDGGGGSAGAYEMNPPAASLLLLGVGK